MKMKAKISYKRIMATAERSMMDTSNPGFCTECGHEQDGCEPDMRNGQCEKCKAMAVYGAEELLIS